MAAIFIRPCSVLQENNAFHINNVVFFGTDELFLYRFYISMVIRVKPADAMRTQLITAISAEFAGNQ